MWNTAGTSNEAASNLEGSTITETDANMSVGTTSVTGTDMGLEPVNICIEEDCSFQSAADGDFDGDGRSDILWQNAASGMVYAWRMDGPTILSFNHVATLDDPDWEMRHIRLRRQLPGEDRLVPRDDWHGNHVAHDRP